MSEIKLERGVWQLDESKPLGPAGGFGEVFRGSGEGGDVAIKRLKMTASAAAHREMNIGKLLASRTLKNVVPVLDYGQDADTDRYYLVMPVCEYSLQDYATKKSVLTWDEAKAAALDIIAGLTEVGDIVHRDLKPANVLWLDGRWQLADFGIAKFVEDSTSLETLRRALTPSYAAPEQWLLEPPTRATDIYALGCILHALLNGEPPFRGDNDKLRHAHLHAAPPDLNGMPLRLNGLVNTMLRKSPGSRPTLERCATVINEVADKPQRASNLALAAVGNLVSQAEAAEEAKKRAEEVTRLARQAQAMEAMADLKKMIGWLFSEIEASSESVKREKLAVQLGPAHLSYAEPEPINLSQLSGAPPPNKQWDIIAFSMLKLRSQIERYRQEESPTYTFSATLMFSTAPNDTTFRWREVSFWGMNSPSYETPFAVSPRDRDFDLAMGRGMHVVSIAHGPLTIDAEDEGDFQDRWLTIFAKSADKKFRHPGQMPPPANFFK
ncbi:serine/threonine-protein kinase [Mesorhizobium mediterraneum]|uniref:serine/threonine-protein kinase n=1 Tax=Mesorhizobium mediterraneum TaxID=43617 RepID=UPI001785F519|nr:serine/threonine-protein kinase [Mesorhizobium mediterraneum]